MSPLQTVLAAAFAAACLYTVFGYPGKYGALTGRSRLFRTVGVVILDLLLGLFLLGTFIDFRYETPPRVAALRFVFYFGACLLLALSLLFISLLDWLEGIVALRRGQRDIIQNIVREAQERKPEEKEGPDGDQRPGGAA